MKDRLIPIDRKMRRRIALKITPRIVNEQFREALSRYNKVKEGQSCNAEIGETNDGASKSEDV